MYRLHGFPTQNTMKTLYVLEELGVEYEFCLVDLTKGEHMSDSFRSMTPVGKVPILEHDGEFLFESGPISRYVASFEKSPLYPADKLQRARVDQWMTFFSCHPGHSLSAIYFEKIIKPKFNLGEPDAAVCAEEANLVHKHFQMIENWFEHTDWLANDALSIADPFTFAYVEQVNDIDFPLNDYPHIQAWFERLAARESTTRALKNF
jgi:glutathione S-transferase